MAGRSGLLVCVCGMVGVLWSGLCAQHHPPHHEAVSDTQPDRHMESPVSLNGSGTSWVANASPVYAVHGAVGDWQVMNHGSVYLRYTDQNANNDNRRGRDAVDAPNWLMSMWERGVGDRNRLVLRGMLSLDPLTEGNDGYPLLFQTGETFEGRPLVDRQHPHDLFMELSATWLYDWGNSRALFAYAGYPGEPALGPTTFMHRSSSDMNPDAPLGHHWHDATHITFGVLTAGMVMGPAKVDGSVFTGREPDEERWNFDRPRFDSYGGRFSYRFLDGLEGQVSAAFLRSPEILHPDADQVRATASATAVFSPLPNRSLSTTVLYGGNVEIENGEESLTNSFLVESELAGNRFVPYGRYEYAQKKGGDLGLPDAEDEVFGVHALTAGSAARLFDFASLSFFAGAQGTMNIADRELDSEYGSFPLSYQVYLRARPVETRGH